MNENENNISNDKNDPSHVSDINTETPTRPSVRPMFERVHPAGNTGRNPLPPSLRANRFDTGPIDRPRNPQGTAHGTRHTAPRNRNKIETRNKRRAALYIFALVVAIAGCLTLFLLYLPDIMDRAAQGDTSPTPAPEPTVVIPPDMRNLTAQIIRIGTATSAIEVIDIATGTLHEFTHTETTQMTNIHGSAMDFEDLALGQLVDISFESRTNQLVSAHQSRSAWERRNQTNLRIDTENETITVGNAVFSFDPQHTMVLHRGQRFPINNLQASSTVTLFGYDDQIWLIQLVAGNGFLQLLNTDRVLSGSIEVGQDFYSLAGIESIELQEGTHIIEVRGQNIENFVRTVEIRYGEAFILNLNETVLRTGQLTVDVTPDDAYVFVNGELVTGPIDLEFGTHMVRVESDGYLSREQTININAETYHISVVLESAIRTGILHVTTVPANAQIFVNNQFVGFSELFHELPFGNYSVIARLAGHDDSPTLFVEVVPDGVELTIILHPTYAPAWPPLSPLPPVTEAPASPTLPPFMQPPQG